MIKSYVDLFYTHSVTGWAFSEDETPLIVEAWCQNKLIGTSQGALPRPDVGAAHPQTKAGYRSGFIFPLSFAPVGSALCQIHLIARPVNPESHVQPQIIFEKNILTDFAINECNIARETPLVSGSAFPADVVRTIYTLWPDNIYNFDLIKDQEAFADKIIFLLSLDRVGLIAPIAKYVRFLHTAWAHFQFVRRFFPENDPSRDVDANDFSCKPSTPEEMIAIAHHLYVLSSFGLKGDFAEFGCFKGYSSSMLSYACSLLGIHMHIFDSFAGLPKSDSKIFPEGDFTGSLEEVKQNIASYGAPEVVEYHAGFYSQVLPLFKCPPLISLWMDVDLYFSSRDISQVFDKINPAGTVFSHECKPTDFSGAVDLEPGPDNVVLPIINKFRDMGAKLNGRFILNQTGAFWREKEGIPVLSHNVLLRILSATMNTAS